MATCSCIKGNSFDFVLTHIDCSKMLYEDMSVWMEGHNYVFPDGYDVWISTGGGAGRRIRVKTLGHTVIDAESLGTSGMLPDGVYCFRAESCTDMMTRYKMNTCRLECCLQEYIYQMVSREAPESEYGDVEQIERLLDIARYNAEVKNPEYAMQVYEEAKTMIEDLNCNCKCLK